MFYRWLHNIWKYFWTIVLTVLFVIVFLAGGIFGLLQLDTSKLYITERIEAEFQKQYKNNLSIGELDGFLPFNMEFQDVVITTSDSIRSDTLVNINRINSEVDVWGLLQNRLIITGFSVDEPVVTLRRDDADEIIFLEKKTTASGEAAQSNRMIVPRVEIIAPMVSILNGRLFFEPVNGRIRSGNLPDSYAVENINADFFLELTDEQRYLDIEHFSAYSDDLDMREINLNGQVYNDNRYLEFNSLNIRTGNSNLNISGDVDGVDIYKPNLSEQLFSGKYNLEIKSPGFYLTEFDDLITELPAISEPLTFDFDTDGTVDSLWIDNLSLGIGESFISINGLLRNLYDKSIFDYQLAIAETELRKRDAEHLLGRLDATQYQVLENLRFRGNANGTIDSVSLDLKLLSPHGELTMKGSSRFRNPYEYSGSLRGKNVNIAPLFDIPVDTTSLNFDSYLSGMGFEFEDAVAELTTTFYNSLIDDTQFDRLDMNSSLVSGMLKQEYRYQNNDETIEGDGWIDFTNDAPQLSYQGAAGNLNLSEIFRTSGIAATKLNLNYKIELTGLKRDEVEGRANLDIKPSVFNGDTVRAHQLYMDLDSSNQQSRSFRLTSSLIDLNITGQIYPTLLTEQFHYWAGYLEDRFKSEILLQGEASESFKYSGELPKDLLVLDGSIQVKDIGLIKNYFPDFPSTATDSKINFNINTEGHRLLFSADINANEFRYGDWNITDGRAQLTANFRSDKKLKEFSRINLKTDIDQFRSSNVDLDSLVIGITAKQDSLFMQQQIESITGDSRLSFAGSASYQDSMLTMSVNDFFLGNEEYSWRGKESPTFTYNRNGKLTFHDFRFENQNEFIELQGVMSADNEDSVQYTLSEVNLKRISDLIKGKISFDGILNGRVVTQSLTDRPTIEGKLAINQFKLDDRLIGDASFTSEYNRVKDRFDTQINVITDSTKYNRYLEENDGIGQNIKLDGYFVAPDLKAEQDTVYYFDANFEQVDLWFLALIVDNIFNEVEGQASGDGYITGNLDDYDFHADFLTQNVFARPRFVETNYFINGRVEFDRHDGVVLDSLHLLDTKGGTGTVWGTIDLNNFNPITYLDLSLDMNRLQFMNNEYDPDIPFYGNISGTGSVILDGSNTDMYLRTETPVILTSDSEVSIPLIEETSLSENNRFIRFVDSFDKQSESTLSLVNGSQKETPVNMGPGNLEDMLKDLTFSERVDLDLQFNAPSGVFVRLIFDPVTGEILRSQGMGQLRITMQDQDVQMFGNYNISSGSYQFVSGEIFSRRLELESGGSIIWEGDPDNARLDISAVYRARPNIASLISRASTDASSQNSSQQVPVDLIVNITGTVSSVENEYYFQLPNSLEISSSSTLSYRLNQINRDEQEKLIQATSILVTGQFIPSQSAENSTTSLSQRLTRGSAVINPLLSNQVISPLLSNQINSLLNSDVSRFDIDFNLNAYNEIDLGIALRLYNDRLILRREGQITGGADESSLSDRIGDLNATYRIRKGLSLTAFHRQDQILGNIATTSQAGDVTPSVDGVGLEAQVQYNTWQELLNRVSSTFNKIFGIKEEKEKEIKEENNITEILNK